MKKSTIFQIGLVAVSAIAEILLLGFEDKADKSFEGRFNECYDKRLCIEQKEEN